MDATPKVSFIPKGSLMREESFLERPRPRSTLGLLAALSFIISVGSYVGLRVYDNSIEEKINSMTDKVVAAQQKFSVAPQVEEARLFSSRAELARELLDKHTVVHPIFAFLSNNTPEGILYEKLSFSHGLSGLKVNLTGESPSYAVLAYQSDIFRTKKELLDFAVKDISLTKFGTVTFSLSLSFSPKYLSYANSLSKVEDVSAQAAIGGNHSAAVSSPGGMMGETSMSTSTKTSASSTVSLSDSISATSSTPSSVSGQVDVRAGSRSSSLSGEGESVVAPVVRKQSVLQSLWSKFKFW